MDAVLEVKNNDCMGVLPHQHKLESCDAEPSGVRDRL